MIKSIYAACVLMTISATGVAAQTNCVPFPANTPLPFEANSFRYESAVAGVSVSTNGNGEIDLTSAVRATPIDPVSAVFITFRLGSVPDLSITAEFAGGSITNNYPSHVGSTTGNYGNVLQVMNGIAALIFDENTAMTGGGNEQGIVLACPMVLP